MALIEQQDNPMTRRSPSRLSEAVGQGAALAMACFISYVFITYISSRVYLVSRDGQLLGGMWAAVVTVFIYRESYRQSIIGVLRRIPAILLSFALSLVYLLIFPFDVRGMAVLIGISAIALTLIGRSEDIIATGITTTVVMIVACISPLHAWKQPILLFVDTVVGSAVGIIAVWVSLTIEANLNLQSNRTRVVQSR
jgi:uncharacterized membrane protein YccC